MGMELAAAITGLPTMVGIVARYFINSGSGSFQDFSKKGFSGP